MGNQYSLVREDFLDTFQLLTPKQKKIWCYLQSMAKNLRVVFPGQGTIAKAVGCCRETVVETIKKFVEAGWLQIIKRFWRSHVYFVNEQLINLDVRNPKTFAMPKSQGQSTPNPTTNPTPTVFTSDTQIQNVEPKNESVQATEPKKEEKAAKNETYIHEELRHFNLSWRDVVMLSKYSLRIVRLALEDYKTYRLYKHVRNLAAFLTNRCQHYCKQAAPVC